MAVLANTYQTYSSVSIPEEVLTRIDRIEREESPVYSSAKKTKINSKHPEWQTQALSASGDNANAEAASFANTAVTATVRVKNYTQILRKVVSISGTNQACDHYGYENEMDYQKALKAIELKRDCEYALVQNVASVGGSDGVAPYLGGVESWVTSNVSRGSGGSNGGYNSGTGFTVQATDGTQRPFTEKLLLDVLQAGYDNGAKFTQLHTGSWNKIRMSSFQGNATRTSQEQTTVSNTIKVYESDFGNLSVMINPQQRTRTALLYDMSKFEVLQLRPMSTGKLAKTNDSDEEYVLTEITARVVQKGLGVIADLTTA